MTTDPGSDDPSTERTKRRSPVGGWRFVVGALAAAAVLAIVLRATLVDFYYVGSGSMRPTLVEGDGLLVDRTAGDAAEIARGDVVVFDGRGSLLPYGEAGAIDPFLRALRLSGDDTLFVKRVIAVGGDRLSCCDGGGSLVLNGTPLAEPYLAPGAPASAQDFAIEVPRGRLWLMGDHRVASEDSRSLLGAPGGGMIPVDRVVGTVERVVWPPERSGSLNPKGTP
ncbi:signal peptidase I [Arthrobacter halodurans]|uniref:Signal peptidase I n=1 Tax=Arthrobacter halodurans TaxID=516699 RepID=A0ABV4UHZ8_9MICC